MSDAKKGSIKSNNGATVTQKKKKERVLKQIMVTEPKPPSQGPMDQVSSSFGRLRIQKMGRKMVHAPEEN